MKGYVSEKRNGGGGTNTSVKIACGQGKKYDVERCSCGHRGEPIHLNIQQEGRRENMWKGETNTDQRRCGREIRTGYGYVYCTSSRTYRQSFPMTSIPQCLRGEAAVDALHYCQHPDQGRQNIDEKPNAAYANTVRSTVYIAASL